MVAIPQTATMTPNPVRAILVVIGCTLGLCFNIATVFNGTLTTFLKPIAEQTGWSRGEISLGLSLAMAPLLLMLPWIGRLGDRIGPRRVIAVGAPLFSLMLVGVASAVPSYPLYLFCCVLLGVAGAATYNTLYYALLPHFFERRLGLAMGVVSAGTGLGLMLAPLGSQFFIAAFGWRGAYVALATVTCVIVLASSLLLLRDPSRQAVRAGAGVSAGAALRSLRFWQAASAYFLTGVAINGTVVHLVPLLTDQGMTVQSAAVLASYLGIGVLAARIVSGFLLDYLDAGVLGAVSFVLAAVGIVLLVTTPTAATAAVLLIGTALGAEGGILGYVTRRLFGIQSYGAVIGAMAAMFLAGVLIGPLVSGAAYDATGGYDGVLYVFAALCALAAALHAPVTWLAARGSSNAT